MRRFYNKGAKGLSGGQVKLDKMGNNDGKISGEDFAVIRSQKMGGGMMQRPMYKDGSPKTKQEKNFKITKNNIGKIKETIKKGRSEAFKSNVKPFKDGGMMEEAKEINSKIKNSRTLKMGGGMMKRPMYKAGSSNPKATSETAKKQAKAGMESQKTSTETKIAKKILNPLNLKGAVEGYKKLGSKIKDKFTKKKLMGGGRVKRAAGGPGLYANIKAKKDRIAAGSGEKMRKVGTKGAPTAQNFINAAKTAKKV